MAQGEDAGGLSVELGDGLTLEDGDTPSTSSRRRARSRHKSIAELQVRLLHKDALDTSQNHTLGSSTFVDWVCHAARAMLRFPRPSITGLETRIPSLQNDLL